jgi:hypothetical protein
LLDHYQQIIFNKIAKKNPDSTTVAPIFSINNTTENCRVDSFEDFIPFSDSIFITGDEFDKFILQLSNFLCESYDSSSLSCASPKYKDDPTRYVVSKNITDAEGNMIASESEYISFPVLFRGGVAYDEVTDIKTNYIFNRENQFLNSITGKGIVKAVGLEGQGFKGPRVFCYKEFVNNLGNEVKQMFILPIKRQNDIFELLWPVSQFIQNNDSSIEIKDFNGMLIPAINLWRAYNHEEFGIHYYKLMKLIIKSALHYFKLKSYEKESIDYITEILIKEDLGIKIKDLMHSKYV